jgi:hypothetical protein
MRLRGRLLLKRLKNGIIVWTLCDVVKRISVAG